MATAAPSECSSRSTPSAAALKRRGAQCMPAPPRAKPSPLPARLIPTRRRRLRLCHLRGNPRMTAKKKPNFTSLSAFQAEFNPDIKNPSKIKAGLAALLKEGKEAAEFETEFCARCGVASSQIGKYRE